MKRCVLFASVVFCALSVAAQEAPRERWAFFFEELEVGRLLQKLSREHEPRSVAFVDVNLISMAGTPRVEEHQTVIVDGGRIIRLGPTASTPVPRGALRVPASGKYLMPGLTDAHVHTLETSSDHILHLLHGITTVREMCGFPWLLRHRDAVLANRVLAATPYVAGHILTGGRLGMYATVVTTPEEAARVVREQKRAGYSYIKTHNGLARDVYEAILKTAAEEHIRVVGHVPVRASIKMAIDGGHYTLEHFKGYYMDNNLTMSTEDWVTPTKGADIWLCPTFYTRVVDEESSRKVWSLSQEIFAKLLPVTDRWIAGTDSGGGYRNMIAGQALIDEVETFVRLGMKPADALRTATSNAAAALLDANTFGTVEAGKRADLLLLDRNPLDSPSNLRNPRGVMARGIWLDSRALDSMRKSLLAIRAKAVSTPSGAQIDTLMKGMTALAGSGWIYRDHQLDELAGMLRGRKRDADADRVLGWRTGGTEGRAKARP